MKKSKYVVQLKERGKWIDTVWANPEEQTDFDSPVIPSCKSTATKALKRAQRVFAMYEYRLQAVAND